ncbi:ATP-binding cassette domain-containing protein [Dehalococcoidales bacterium]|nr:ATP-binding cassette domain-containing protein [Dehalococcoidales bacterium]MCL0094403.1 ATP-binding cassette domain-containing protein [Dehalococcoidales bacterium]
MEEAIKTFKLTKEFNELVAVSELDLTIKVGELFSLLGPNGAGKTTTINMLCGLLKPTQGTAQVLGYDLLRDSLRIKELIGVCPQETAISEQLNAWENLELIGKLYRLGDREIKRRAEELLEKVGLIERAKDRVGKFSGGMKRRLSLIMALVHNPPLLFLDEPTLGLDPQSRRAIWEYIGDLKEKKTILLTTHYLEEADFLSDRIGIIEQGKIVASDTPQGLKSQYGEPTLEEVFLKITGKELRD